jgi:hypothetical protein
MSERCARRGILGARARLTVRARCFIFVHFERHRKQRQALGANWYAVRNGLLIIRSYIRKSLRANSISHRTRPASHRALQYRKLHVPGSSRGHSDFPWGRIYCLTWVNPEAGGLWLRFLHYLEAALRSCGRFSAGRKGGGTRRDHLVRIALVATWLPPAYVILSSTRASW